MNKDESRQKCGCVFTILFLIIFAFLGVNDSMILILALGAGFILAEKLIK